MANATYKELEAELRYVTWQRDRLAEALGAISNRWKCSLNDEYKTKGLAIADILMAIMGGSDG